MEHRLFRAIFRGGTGTASTYEGNLGQAMCPWNNSLPSNPTLVTSLLGRWPVKSVKFVLSLLKNAEANAEGKGLETEDLVIRNININQAPKTRRRTYRAHGRINPYQGHPCHIEIHLMEPAAEVSKADSSALVRPANKRQLAQRRIAAGRA